MNDNLRHRLGLFQNDARACTRCVELKLIHEEERGCARPLLTKEPSGALGVLVVGEAPNLDDTFDPKKGYLTYDADTDPTGRFMRSLLMDEAGIAAHEIDDVLFTNSVLCLPRKQADKFPVTTKHMEQCSPWLKRLIDDSAVTIVVTMGATALRATSVVERHQLALKSAAGKLHDWYGRKLLPLYHASRLGRLSRSEEAQRSDMRALREHLDR
jgi:uracil-DNA glycosylase family 4